MDLYFANFSVENMLSAFSKFNTLQFAVNSIDASPSIYALIKTKCNWYCAYDGNDKTEYFLWGAKLVLNTKLQNGIIYLASFNERFILRVDFQDDRKILPPIYAIVQ